MRKLLFFTLLLCLCNSLVYASEKEFENPYSDSKAFQLEYAGKNLELETIDDFLFKVDDNFSYFMPKGQGVKMRTGPGVQYEAYNKRLSEGVQWLGFDYGETWIAGIISNEEIVGDDVCSAWYEVMLIEFFWETWSDFARASGYSNITDGSEKMKPAYICKDLIYKEVLQDKHKKILIERFYEKLRGAVSPEQTVFTLNTSIDIYNYEKEYITSTKPNMRIAIDPISLADAENPYKLYTWVYAIVNENNKLQLGRIYDEQITSLPVIESDKAVLTKYLEQNKANINHTQ